MKKPLPLLDAVYLKMLALIMTAYQDCRPPPSLRELSRVLGIRHAAVSKRLERLRRSGLVSYTDGETRTLQPACYFFVPTG